MSGRSKAGSSSRNPSGRPSKKGQKTGRPGLIVKPGKRTKNVYAHPSGKEQIPIRVVSSSSSGRSSSRKHIGTAKRKSVKERHATLKSKSPAKHTTSGLKKLGTSSNVPRNKPSPNTTSEQYIHPFTSSETGFQNVRVERESGSKGKHSAELSAVKVSAVNAKVASRSRLPDLKDDSQQAYPVSNVTTPSIGQFQHPSSHASLSRIDSQARYGDPPGQSRKDSQGRYGDPPGQSRKDSPGRYAQKESPGRYAQEFDRYAERESPARYKETERKSPARYVQEPTERYVERKSPGRYTQQDQPRYGLQDPPPRRAQDQSRYVPQPARRIQPDQSRYVPQEPPRRRLSPLQNQCEYPIEGQYRQECLCVPQECLPPMVVVPDHCATAIGQVDVDSIRRTHAGDLQRVDDNRQYDPVMKDDFDYNRAYNEKRSRLSLCREYLEKKRREKIKQICKDKSEGRPKKPLVCIDKSGKERYVVDVLAEQKKLPVCKDKTEPQKYEVKQLKTSPATQKMETPRKVEPTKKLEKPKLAERSEMLKTKSSSSKVPLVAKKTQSRSQSMSTMPSKSSKSKSSLARSKSRTTSKGILGRPKKWSNQKKLMVGTAAVALLVALSAFGLYYYDMLDFE